ncbi:MAG: helix-hairpin-helix domain-containing protein [Rhizobacter sp.]|nr:helix-hairpin-helix domain-containing protein [Chlorobiales bacterium]
MNWFNKLATKLGLLRAEIVIVLVVVLFMLLGLVLKYSFEYRNRLELLDKVSAEFFLGSESDSLLSAEQLAFGADTVADTLRADSLAVKAKLNLNAATESQLASLPGVSAALADRIVRYRIYKGGRLRSLDELLNVKGIGERRLKDLKETLTLE